MKPKIDDYKAIKENLESQISAHLEFVGSFGKQSEQPTTEVQNAQEKFETLSAENRQLHQSVQQLQANESEKMKQKTKEINGLKISNNSLSESVKDIKNETEEIMQQLNMAKASLNCQQLLNETLKKNR